MVEKSSLQARGIFDELVDSYTKLHDHEKTRKPDTNDDNSAEYTNPKHGTISYTILTKTMEHARKHTQAHNTYASAPGTVIRQGQTKLAGNLRGVVIEKHDNSECDTNLLKRRGNSS